MSRLDEYKEFVREVKERSSLEEIVGQDAQLVSAGRMKRCRSPLRPDRNPSFFVYPDQNSWWDFGANEGGDVVDYVRKKHQLDFKDAIQWLAERVGMAWESEGSDPDTRAAIESLVERQAVLSVLTEAAYFYHRVLPGPIREQLHSQWGLSDDTINRLKIGWAHTCSALFSWLHDEFEYQIPLLLKTGLFVPTADPGILKDFFDSRIVFPYWVGGHCVYMIGRRVEGHTENVEWEQGKYKKLQVRNERKPHISEYVSNEWLYGEDDCRKQTDRLIIAEGVTDCIAAKQAGYASASPVTTRFSQKQIERLGNVTQSAKTIFICNDVDENDAGQRGALDTAEHLAQLGRDVRIVDLSIPNHEGKIDLCEFLRDGHDLEEALAKATPYLDIALGAVNPSVNLSEQLAPILKVVAQTDSLMQERYTRAICERFNLPRTLVEKELGVQRTNAFNPLENHVFVADDGYYYREKVVRKSIEEEPISNFLIAPRVLLTEDDGTQVLRTDLKLCDGTWADKVDIISSAWTSRRNFVGSLPLNASFTGSDDDVQVIKTFVSRVPVPQYRGVRQLGWHDTSKGPVWVLADRVLDASGYVESPDIVFLGNSPLANRISYEPADEKRVKSVAQIVLPELLNLNTVQVMLPIIGFFHAAAVAPFVRKALGHFPLLWVFGTHGSGKTTLIREVFLPLSGVSKGSDMFSCTDTDFSILNVLAGARSIVAAYDEYRGDMGQNRIDRFHRFCRRIYNGEVEQRGRANLQLATYQLSAPMCVCGEALPDRDPALIERLLISSPSKLSLTPERAASLEIVRRQRMDVLAGPYVQFLMTRNLETDMATARAYTERAMSLGLHGGLPPRVEDNLIVMMLGIVLYEAWAHRFDIQLPEIDIVAAVKGIVSEILDGDDHVKDAFDQFYTYLSTLAHMGHLEQGKHFEWSEEGLLMLHIMACYQTYLVESARAGEPNVTNGHRALMRLVDEKCASDSYVVEAGRGIVGGRRVRTVTIDPSKIPETLGASDFPRRSTGVMRNQYGQYGEN